MIYILSCTLKVGKGITMCVHVLNLSCLDDIHAYAYTIYTYIYIYIYIYINIYIYICIYIYKE